MARTKRKKIKPLSDDAWEAQGIFVPPTPQSKEEKIAILGGLPAEAQRINVKDCDGRSRWRTLSAVKDTDTITFRKGSREPNVMFSKSESTFVSSAVHTVPQDQTVDQLRALLIEKEDFVKKDSLVRATRTSMDDPEPIFRETVIRFAEIASSIAYDRKRAESEGKETSLIARREMVALTSIRDAALRRIDQKLKKQEIDLGSLSFRNILQYMLQTFYDVMVSVGLEEGQAGSVITTLAKTLDSEEWQAQMNKAIRGG